MHPPTPFTVRQAYFAAACVLLIAMPVLAACGAAPTPSGACAAPILGIITDENYQVVDLAPEGAAAQAGVQVGDILISISPGPPLPPGEPTPTPFVCNDVIISVWPFTPLDRLPVALTETPTPRAKARGVPISPSSPLATVMPKMAAAQPVSPLTQPASPLAESMATPAYAMPTPDLELAMALRPYETCMADRTREYRDCVRLHPSVLTSTVYFTQGQQPDWKTSNSSNRILLKLRRGDQELELVMTPNYEGHRRRAAQMHETPTPFPPDYHGY